MNTQRKMLRSAAILIVAGIPIQLLAMPTNSIMPVAIGSLLVGMGVSLWAMAEYLPRLAMDYLYERYEAIHPKSEATNRD